MKVIQVKGYGGPEVLELGAAEIADPPPGYVQVKLQAVGVNFRDIYYRSGEYKTDLPYIPGAEGAGTVVSVGNETAELKTGDRVVYSNPFGSYAEYVNIPAERAVRLPGAIDAHTAAAVFAQGLTAHYLAKSAYRIKPGDTCLIHAAAGGTGLLLTQIAKRQGGTVIGTVSTERKMQAALASGCDEVILYTRQDFEVEVRRITGGRGVQVVYDSVGKDTFDKSLKCLAPLGYLILCGQSSGPVPPFNPRVLNDLGSLYLTRPSLKDYTATREELVRRADELLGWVGGGQIEVRIDSKLPLEEAAEAHRRLEGRHTIGKVLLIP